MQCNLLELDRKDLLSEAEKYITNFNNLTETEQFTSIMRSDKTIQLSTPSQNILMRVLKKIVV